MSSDDVHEPRLSRSFSRDGLPKSIPPLWFFIAIAVQVSSHRFVPVGRDLAVPWNWTGALFVVLGIAFAVAANRQFMRAGTPVRPFEPMTAIVTGGIFAYTRNPMYLGMTAVLAGIALLLGSLAPLVVVPLFVLFITFGFIRHEERVMEEAFGDEYVSYKRRVRRWL